MTDKQINESIRNAIEQQAPDLLEQLEKELGFEQEVSQTAQRQAASAADGSARVPVFRKRRRFYQRMAGIAAALLLCLGGFALYDRQPEVCAVVGLDVNPSMELSLDRNDRVIEATAVNEDGEEILSDLDFKGSDVTVAGNAIVGALLTRGYLTDTSNSILISVRGSDEVKSKAIEEKLTADLNGFLENSTITAAILGQYVEEDEGIISFASANRISEGKAWLIRELTAKDQRLTEDSLLKLSTQELILLGQEKGVFTGTTYGTADTSKYISEEEALDAAAKAAGITGAPEGARAEFECDDGVIIYEVEFTSGGVEYDYDIDAVTGKVLSAESETADRDDDDDHDDRDDDDDHDRDDDDDDDDD